MNLDPWSLLFLSFAAGTALLAAGHLASRQNPRLLRTFLVLILALSLVRSGLWFVVASGLVLNVPRITWGFYLLGALPTTLYYFLVRAGLESSYRPNLWALLLACALPSLQESLIYFLQHGFGIEPVMASYEYLRAGHTVALGFSDLARVSALTGYELLWVGLALRAHHRAQTRDGLEVTRGGFQALLWWGGLVLIAVAFFDLLLMILARQNYSMTMSFLSHSLRASYWCVFGFLALRGSMEVALLGRDARGPAGLPLDREQVARWLHQLQSYMEAQRPYRKHDLRRSELATGTGIPTQMLSRLINEELGTNFRDYINGHRITLAQELLNDPDWERYTLMAVAEEAGFRSKATFYRVFKKHVGRSPSEWRSSQTARDDPAIGG